MKTCKLPDCDKQFNGHNRREYCSDECFKQNRREYRKAFDKRQKDSLILNYWIVYELPTGYVGQTNQPINRMYRHGAKEYKILAICYNRAEALDLEALYQTLSPDYKKPDDKLRLTNN